MITTLYNLETHTIGTIRNGHYPIPINFAHIVELEVVYVPNPATENQVATSEMVVDLELKQYKQVWTVRDKTEYELALEAAQADWDHPQFAKRIVAPVELALQYPQFEVWFRINDLPIVRKDKILYCYCSEILKAHQPLIDNISEASEEDRPAILTNDE